MARDLKSLSDLHSHSLHLYNTLASESDTACALVLNAHLESALDLLLQRYAGNDERISRLARKTSQYPHRIDMAYAFGLIPDPMANNLYQSNEIRNLFAHCGTPTRFESPKILERLAEMTFSDKWTSLSGDDLRPEGSRQKFTAIGSLSLTLLLGSLQSDDFRNGILW